MNSELQTGENKTHSTVVRDDWAADGKTEVLRQSYALKDNNNDTGWSIDGQLILSAGNIQGVIVHRQC